MIEEKKLPELQPWLTPFSVKKVIGNREYLQENPSSFIKIK